MSTQIDELSLQAFEARAAEAEKRLTALETKVPKANTTAGGSGGAVIQKYISQFQELKGVLIKAQEEQKAVEKERDEAKEAQAKAEEEIVKLNYRIKHLVRVVKESDEKMAMLQGGQQQAPQQNGVQGID